MLLLAGVAGILVGLAAAMVTGNRLTLELTLLGEPEMLVEYGQAFADPGVEPVVYGSLYWKSGTKPKTMAVSVTGHVEEGTLGKYTLTYRAQYRDLSREVSRVVRVVDTQSPEIILTGEQDYRAVDNYDGDITEKVVCTEEYGKRIYAVVDSSGNPAYAEREIPKEDHQPPVITLAGDAEMTISVGTVFQEPGYQAVDGVDGDVSEQVIVTGAVDWLTPGKYDLTYSVSDEAGNAAEATRQVEVVAKQRPKTIWPTGKVIYLTFDDGPGPDTRRLLDLLDRYGVKATFFVTDSGYPAILEQIVNRGHSIGIHTASHNYEQIYADPESYFADLYKMRQVIYEATGVETTLLRFPGGSSNTVSRHTSQGLMTTLVTAVQDAGFQYFDWNVDSDDAGKAKTAEDVAENVKAGVANHDVSVVLMHDVHSYTVDAMEDILIWGLNNGYRFEALTENSPGMHHSVFN